MKLDEYSWGVGLFEGEGCIDIVRSAHGKRRAYARVRLTSTDRDVVERFASIFPVGHMRGPLRQGVANRKPYWSWEVAGLGAVEFLRQVVPYLCERRACRAFEALTEAGALAHLQQMEIR